MAKRIVQLDGVRTMAIGAVFIHHSLHVPMLWAGVDLFFILSGFLITSILIGRKTDTLGGYFSHFYARRARRILPPYLLTLVVISLFAGWAWLQHWYRYLFLMNLLVAFQTLDTPEAMYMFWSLAVEEQFYLAWPFVTYFFSEVKVAWVAGGLIIAAPLLRWFCTPLFANSWAIYSLTPFRMDLLAMGALLAVGWRRFRPQIERYGIFGPLLSLAAIGALFALSRNPSFTTTANTPQSNVWIYECSLIASTGVILWALSGRYVGMLTWRPVVYIGRISYTIYLIHEMVLILLRPWHTNPFVITIVGGAIVVAYAAISWHFFEEPILHWRTREERTKPEVEEEILVTRGT